MKIAYGMGEVDAERARRTEQLTRDKDKRGQKAWRREQARYRRVRAAGVYGIADPASGPGVLAAGEQGLDPREVIGALRWDTCNPWARFEQVLSTHPLVVRRIAALEASGLPGAPTRWSATAVARSCVGPELSRARRRFALELVVRAAPLAAVLTGVYAWHAHRWVLLAQAVVALGVALFVRTATGRPLTSVQQVDRVASLLRRLDASPVTGLPVSVRGHVIGRGMPGYVLSPDLVVQDSSGFVPVRYRQPWPFARELFGVLSAPDLVDQEVLVTGWYRRAPAPVLELRSMVPAHGRTVRGFLWVASYLAAVGLAVGGGLAWLLLIA